jgi:hypothetical protein
MARLGSEATAEISWHPLACWSSEPLFAGRQRRGLAATTSRKLLW